LDHAGRHELLPRRERRILKTPNAALFIRENLAVLPKFVPPVLALAVRARWAQWLAGIALLVMMIGFTVAFSPMLN
jgi:hypothetical protein